MARMHVDRFGHRRRDRRRQPAPDLRVRGPRRARRANGLPGDPRGLPSSRGTGSARSGAPQLSGRAGVPVAACGVACASADRAGTPITADVRRLLDACSMNRADNAVTLALIGGVILLQLLVILGLVWGLDWL